MVSDRGNSQHRLANSAVTDSTDVCGWFTDCFLENVLELGVFVEGESLFYQFFLCSWITSAVRGVSGCRQCWGVFLSPGLHRDAVRFARLLVTQRWKLPSHSLEFTPALNNIPKPSRFY